MSSLLPMFHMSQEGHFLYILAEVDGGADRQFAFFLESVFLFLSQISEPAVVQESFCEQYEGIWLQLHLHAGILHEAWH